MRRGGLGIGLTLVQRLVELHSGRVEAHSEGLGQGSEFTISLPAMARPPALPEAEPAAGQPDMSLDAIPQGASLRIMIVDDLPDMAASLAELLTLWGHEVRFAIDGAAALDLAREFRPELVLLDIGMPGMNGYELARRLRQEYGQDMRLVALTGFGAAEDRQRACEAGLDQHLTKPVEMGPLQALLHETHAALHL